MNQQKPKLERRIELAEVPKLPGAETMDYAGIKNFFLNYEDRTYVKTTKYDRTNGESRTYYELLN